MEGEYLHTKTAIATAKALSPMAGVAGGLKGVDMVLSKTLNLPEYLRKSMLDIADVMNQDAKGKRAIDIFFSESGKSLATRMTIDAIYTQAQPAVILGAAALGAYGAYKGVKYISNKYYKKKASE